MTELLKPCPFCGGKAKIHATITKSIPNYCEHYCYCVKCNASGESFTDTSSDGSSVFKAIDAWNKRYQYETAFLESGANSAIDALPGPEKKSKSTWDIAIEASEEMARCRHECEDKENDSKRAN